MVFRYVMLYRYPYMCILFDLSPLPKNISNEKLSSLNQVDDNLSQKVEEIFRELNIVDIESI